MCLPRSCLVLLATLLSGPAALAGEAAVGFDARLLSMKESGLQGAVGTDLFAQFNLGLAHGPSWYRGEAEISYGEGEPAVPDDHSIKLAQWRAAYRGLLHLPRITRGRLYLGAQLEAMSYWYESDDLDCIHWFHTTKYALGPAARWELPTTAGQVFVMALQTDLLALVSRSPRRPENLDNPGGETTKLLKEAHRDPHLGYPGRLWSAQAEVAYLIPILPWLTQKLSLGMSYLGYTGSSPVQFLNYQAGMAAVMRF